MSTGGGVDPARDERLLWLAFNFDRLQDPEENLYTHAAGMFDPKTLSELEPMITAWARGTAKSKVRLLAVICPGPRNHTLCEIYPPNPPGLLLTRFLVSTWETMSLRPGDVEEDRRRGRARIQAPQSDGHTRTYLAGGLLSELTRPQPEPLTVPGSAYEHGRDSLSLRCCVSVSLEIDWVVEQLTAGRRRAVVPAAMLQRNIFAELDTQMDAELDTQMDAELDTQVDTQLDEASACDQTTRGGTTLEDGRP